MTKDNFKKVYTTNRLFCEYCAFHKNGKAGLTWEYVTDFDVGAQENTKCAKLQVEHNGKLDFYPCECWYFHSYIKQVTW